MAGVLPVRVASFVGRVREREEVAALLAEGRPVTLTGPGGSGKTRLAGAVSDAVRDRFQDGVWWVELAGINEPGIVPVVVAASIGVQEHPGRRLTDSLGEQLRDRTLLLVLDNCEHLLASCASLVSSLLRSCPQVTVLATSREPLGVDGETTYLVPPLSVPGLHARSATEVAATDAGELFELRAQQVRPGFRIVDADAAAVADVCRHLDGLPLALELAAARVRVLSPAQIAARLSDRFQLLTGGFRDAPPRQRTLEASIAWSFELLDGAEPLTLARLSVFAGTFDLEAAEVVAGGDGIDVGDVLDLVTTLADKSLLQVEECDGRARYRLLETIRLYAEQRLAELDDPGRVRDRHLDHYVEVARRAQVGLTGPEPDSWMAQLSADLDDLRAAMDRAIAAERPLALLDIAEPTIRFWFERGLYSEMRRRLSAAFDVTTAGDPDRARGLTAASVLAVSGGDYPTAHAFAARAVPPSRATGAGDTLALSLVLRAWSGLVSGLAGSGEARGDAEEAIAVVERLGDDATGAHVLIYAGLVALSGSTLRDGRRLLERAVTVCEEGAITFHLAAAHAVLGLWPAFSGDLDRSREHAHEGLDLSRRVDRPGFGVYALTGLVVADLLQGDERSTREHLARAQTVVGSRGLTGTVFDMLVRQWVAVAAYRFGDLAEAQHAAETTRDAARDRGSRWYEAGGEWLLGVVALLEERRGDAMEHLQRCRDRSSEPRYPFWLGRALLGLAHLARLDEDHGRAWELAHDSLEVLTDFGDRSGTADAIEAIAGVAASSGRPEQAVRLLSATTRFRADTGLGRFPREAAAFDLDLAVAQRQLGAEEAEVCSIKGGGLSLDEAVIYARRGRGQRGRPATGWSSLTPVERDLIRLVAEGRTNAQIGERLFISPNTVKKHLSNVYAKVDVEGRAELAAQAARRDL